MTATTNAEQKHYKRFISGLLVSLGLLLLLAKTGNAPGTATISSPLTNASDIEQIIATGTRINLTEYAENGARFYALQAQDWTQFQQQHRHVVTFDAPVVELFATDTVHSWRVSAHRGKLAQEEDKPILELIDNVVLEQTLAKTNELNLSSDRLTVDTVNEAVTARGNVVLNSGPLQTRGPVMVISNKNVLEFSGTSDQRVVSYISLITADTNTFLSATASEDA